MGKMDSVKSSNEAFVGRMPALVASMVLLAVHQAILGARTNLPYRRVNIGNDRWSWSVEGRKFSVVKDGNAELASVINDQIRSLRVDSERFARLLDDAPPSNMSPAAQEERAARRAEWTREKRSLDYQIGKLQKESETVVERFEIDLASVASRKPLFFFGEDDAEYQPLMLEYMTFEPTDAGEVGVAMQETDQTVEVETPAEVAEQIPVEVEIPAKAEESGDEDEPVPAVDSGLSLSALAEAEEAKEATKATPKGKAK